MRLRIGLQGKNSGNSTSGYDCSEAMIVCLIVVMPRAGLERRIDRSFCQDIIK
jgi:hypothetical protein